MLYNYIFKLKFKYLTKRGEYINLECVTPERFLEENSYTAWFLCKIPSK